MRPIELSKVHSKRKISNGQQRKSLEKAEQIRMAYDGPKRVFSLGKKKETLKGPEVEFSDSRLGRARDNRSYGSKPSLRTLEMIRDSADRKYHQSEKKVLQIIKNYVPK